MKITTKIILFINLMVMFILGVLVFLSYFKYLNLVEDYTSSQAAAFSADLKQAAVKAETLGLKLKNLEQFDDALERIANKENRLETILIFNNRSRIISRFERKKTNPSVAKDLVTNSLLKSKAGTTWTLLSEKNVGFGRYLFTDVVGTKIFVVFVYDRVAVQAENSAIKMQLLVVCLSVLGPSVLILGLIIFLIFRPIQSAYNQIRAETNSCFVDGSVSQCSEYGKTINEIRDALLADEIAAGDKVQ